MEKTEHSEVRREGCHDEAPGHIEAGKGEPVTLLHGLLGGPSNWLGVIEGLANDFRLLAPQFPYYGHAAETSLRGFTHFIRDFLDERGIRRTALCGNSLGGQIAIDFCLQYPKRATRLILTGSAGLYEKPLYEVRNPRLTRDFIREQAEKVFYNKSLVSDELVEGIYRQVHDGRRALFLLRMARASREYRMERELSRIKVPVLLLWGAEDRITPPHIAYQFRRLLPEAELLFLDGCGHAPQVEKPDEFGRIAGDFLRREKEKIS